MMSHTDHVTAAETPAADKAAEEAGQEKAAAEAEAEDEDALLEGEADRYPRIASEVAEFSAAVARVIELTEERRDCTRNEACETLEKLLSILHSDRTERRRPTLKVLHALEVFFLFTAYTALACL